MLYQEKPKELLKRFEALYLSEETSCDDILKWVASFDLLDLARYFSEDDKKRLCVNGVMLESYYYLIRENGKYRLLNKEVFEELYEPVQVNCNGATFVMS